MGVEAFVERADLPPLEGLVEALRGAKLEAMVVMVDGALVAPGKPLPAAWRDVRLRTPAGTVTLARREGGLAVVVWGNADAALRETQQAIVTALAT